MSSIDKPIMDKAAELFGWAYGLGGFDVAVLEFVTFVRAQVLQQLAPELERYDIQGGDGNGVYPDKDKDGEWCKAEDALSVIGSLREAFNIKCRVDADEQAESVKLQNVLFADYRDCRPTDAGLFGWAAAALIAKAQGVVMPERWNVPRPMWKDARQPYGNPLNHADIEAAEKFNLALDEVSRLNAATVLEVNAHCAVIPEPYGWVAAGSFYTDRESAICAAEKKPCIDVYSRPQMNALENRSLQRQELAEELARQLNASCAEIRNMRNLYAAPVSEAKAQGVVLQELRSFEKWWCSTPILRESKRTIAEKAWLAARLNAAPVQQVSVPDGWKLVPVEATEAMIQAGTDEPLAGENDEDSPDDYRAVYRAMLAAAPAAPAADAGMVDMYRHLQTVTPYRFKKIQDASVTDGGDVLYFHKDRFDAALLDDMAANCAKESK